MTDFTMYAGDTKTLEVTVVDADGAVVDISSFTTIRWKLATKVSATAILNKSLGSGITLIDGPAGRFDVSIDSADTEALKPTSYYHEAEISKAGPTVVATIETGTITILPTLIKP